MRSAPVGGPQGGSGTAGILSGGISSICPDENGTRDSLGCQFIEVAI